MINKYLDRPLIDLISVLQVRSFTTHYMGIQAVKNPLDYWVYQEIIHDTDPDFIIEIGVFKGGHLLALAHLCDARNKGTVIGVEPVLDRVDPRVTSHPRVWFIADNGVKAAPEVAAIVGDGRVLIIEDSSHTYENTLAVLESYAPICKSGDYFVVEDTNCNYGPKIYPEFDPYAAVEKFLFSHEEFERDVSRESFVLTWNPGGFLKRK